MFVPRLVVVPCSITEGAEHTFKVMLILKSNVLLNDGDTSRPPLLPEISAYARCTCRRS